MTRGRVELKFSQRIATCFPRLSIFRINFLADSVTRGERQVNTELQQIYLCFPATSSRPCIYVASEALFLVFSEITFVLFWKYSCPFVLLDKVTRILRVLLSFLFFFFPLCGFNRSEAWLFMHSDTHSHAAGKAVKHKHYHLLAVYREISLLSLNDPVSRRSCQRNDFRGWKSLVDGGFFAVYFRAQSPLERRSL